MSESFRLISVEVKAHQVLHLSFADGAKWNVDLSKVIAKHPSLAALADPVIFKRAKVGEWSDTVTWGTDDLELAADNLRAMALEQSSRETSAGKATS
ncbi:DUF2442 domain-containing protein [Comamonas odontotermitis]|uniref:DUF2442 domain-containing protein n=1 Tax=Comamonas odontotermitis TaxID=379895 RepID=UPI00367154F2